MNKKLIAAAVAAVLMAGCASLDGAAARPPMKLGCQLWGVKELWFGKPDKLAAFAEIFPKVRAMGYEGVQCGSFIRMDAEGL